LGSTFYAHFQFRFSGVNAMGIRRIQSYFKDKIKKHRDFFRLYTTGLNRREVERLLKKDTLEALTYYKDKTALKDSPPEEKSIAVKSGDVLLLYSDGITEAMNSDHHLFDQSRLESALQESAHFPAEKIVERINLRLDA
jgi:serine/threonine protein phosphatase PrpC